MLTPNTELRHVVPATPPHEPSTLIGKAGAIGVGDATGEEDGTAAGQVPKAGWQPVPQCAASEPQYP